MLGKPHRQIRTSNRVSSETGTSVIVGEPEPSRYETCLGEMDKLLKPFAPGERKSIVAALAKRAIKEAKEDE